MTYKVFGGTLSLTQSINQPLKVRITQIRLLTTHKEHQSMNNTTVGNSLGVNVNCKEFT